MAKSRKAKRLSYGWQVWIPSGGHSRAEWHRGSPIVALPRAPLALDGEWVQVTWVTKSRNLHNGSTIIKFKDQKGRCWARAAESRLLTRTRRETRKYGRQDG